MKSRILSTARLSFPPAAAIAALLAVPAASAEDYYWDSNGPTIGFAAASGTWLAPTPGPSQGWTTDSNGLAAIGSVTTATTDNLFFGSTAWALPSGTVTVSGPVDAGNLTFAAGTFITLSGGTINLASPSIIATNSFGNTTLNSVLSGSGGLTRTGLGNLILGGANDYTGATILSGAGPITISGATGGLTGTSGVTFNGASLTVTSTAAQTGVDRVNDSAGITSNGGTLTWTNTAGVDANYAETIGSVALSSGQMNFVLANNQNNATNNSQTLTLGGLTQSGTAAVTFAANGTGPQASGGDNMIVVTSAGTTTAGQIIGPWATTGTAAATQTDFAVYNSDHVVPANITASTEDTWLTSTDAYTMTGGATLTGTRTLTALRATGGAQTLNLDFNNLETAGLLNGGTGLLTVNGTGALTTASGGGQLHLTSGSANGSIAVNAPINDNGGAVALVKNGFGTLTLNSATSDYSGGTVINSGILNFANGTLGSGSITVNGGSSGATTFGRLQWASGNTQDISASLTMVNGGNANLDTNGNNVSFANAVGSSSSNLTKVGTGQLTFDANNTYTGETGVYVGTLLVNVAQTNTTSIRVSNSSANGGAAGATLKLGADNVLPTNIPVMVDGQGQNFLDLNGFDQTIGHLFLGSNNGGSTGTVTGSGTSKLTLTAGVTVDAHNQGGGSLGGGSISVPLLDLNNATQNFNTVGGTDGRGALTISSVIQNGGLNKTGVAGQLILTNENTFSGTTTISGGILRLDNGLALQNSALDTTASAAGNGTNGLRINTGVTAVTLGGLTGNKSFAATGGVFTTTTGGYASVASLTLNPGSGTASYDGVIANGAPGMTLTKTGAGTQILTNSNTYTGATAINVGTLVITGATQATSAITFGGGILGLDIGSTVAAAGATVDFTGQSVLVTGAPTLASYTLLTASSITGTEPTLAAPAPSGYELQVIGNELRLVQTGGGNTFATWIATYPGVGAFIGVGDDPDADGIVNGVENFFGTNPSASSAGLVAGVVSGNTFTFTHPQNATPASDLTAAYQWSKDLATFNASGFTDGDGTTVTISPQLDTPAPGTTTVTATVTGTATGKLFVNIKVTQP
jgi:fibronectin-binding autotransporter adhesin